jgi:hypothetical protein
MSHFLFDLNIYNYSIEELKTLINLNDDYDYVTIQNNISLIKDKLLKLKLGKNENREFFLFFDNIALFLKNDLAAQENERLKLNINLLESNQKKLKKEICFFKNKKQKKIQTEMPKKKKE